MRLAEDAVARLTALAPHATAFAVPAGDLGRSLLSVPPSVEDLAAWRSCDLLVVEDVQHLPPAASEPFAALLDWRVDRRTGVLATASVGPAGLPLPARVTSRLAAGLVVGVEPPSKASRLILAGRLCRDRGLTVADDVVAWMAEPPGGARPMLGVLAGLERLGKTHPPPLTLAVVTAGLPAADDAESPVDRVVRRVAEHFGTTVRKLLGKARRRDVLWPRQVAMGVARRVTGLSLPELGRAFGRDATTVWHACRKVDAAEADDPATAALLRTLQALLG